MLIFIKAVFETRKKLKASVYNLFLEDSEANCCGRLSRYCRSAGEVQALLMSAPLIILSLTILITSAVEETAVDVGSLHR
jgi:hypothetical protein